MSEHQEPSGTRRRFMSLLLGGTAVVALQATPAHASADETVIDGGCP